MPPAMTMCLALIGVLFSAALAGLSYSQMKIEDPEKDGFFGLQKNLVENVGLNEWGQLQRSKAARVGSFIVSMIIFSICLVVAAWNGYLVFTQMWTIFSIFAFYLGALNAVAARVAGTCTQGDADRLYGVAISIILYCVGFFAFHSSSRKRLILVSLLPLIPALIWQIVFGFQLSAALIIGGQAACTILEGIPYPESGNEIVFAILWLIAALTLIIGGLSIWRSIKQNLNGG